MLNKFVARHDSFKERSLSPLAHVRDFLFGNYFHWRRLLRLFCLLRSLFGGLRLFILLLFLLTAGCRLRLFGQLGGSFCRRDLFNFGFGFRLRFGGGRRCHELFLQHVISFLVDCAKPIRDFDPLFGKEIHDFFLVALELLCHLENPFRYCHR